MTNTRTEITVETRRVVMVRRRNRPVGLCEGWCARCGKNATMIFLDEAALAVVSHDPIFRVDEDCFHFTTSAGGVLFICISSLLEI